VHTQLPTIIGHFGTEIFAFSDLVDSLLVLTVADVGGGGGGGGEHGVLSDHFFTLDEYQ